MAHAFSRFETLPAGARIAGAMRAHPDLVGGPRGADLHLMQAAPGWFAKGGAEGLLCAGGPGGIGIAVKCEDGSSRPLEPALAAFLGPRSESRYPASKRCRSRTARASASARSSPGLRDV
jgi:L-asparaginase II